jgi:hypothetical protein
MEPINGTSEFYNTQRFGIPLTGRTIHNEGLDTLLGEYFNSLGIERFEVYHSGTNFIQMWFIITGNRRETVFAMRYDLVDFFENNRQELIEEYGQFDIIQIGFYSIEKSVHGWEYPKEIYSMFYEKEEWKELRSWYNEAYHLRPLTEY